MTLLSKRDKFIPKNERSFKGAFYTPLNVVDKAYEKLDVTLGNNWENEYIVWDMCCGVGNLIVKHNNHQNVYMSTLDYGDIDIMVSSKTCDLAHRFQYDYLNDDITDEGDIDYSLTNKVPVSLRKAITEGKKILILINPPYAEAANANNTSICVGSENKAGVAKTKFAKTAMNCYGKATNQLITQFVARISKEIPNAVLAMFSTLKYINGFNFEKFRNVWNAKFLNGFIIHSKVFEGVTGDFPIGFLIWETNNNINVTKTPITEITTDVFDINMQFVCKKTIYNTPNELFLNVWVKRPKGNKEEVVPLTNALTPVNKCGIKKTWSDGAIGYMCSSNNFQNARNYTFLLSSFAAREHGLYINLDNLCEASISFTVQKIINPTWINDNDHFLQPTGFLTDEFKNDCLIWMLFNGKNLSAGIDCLEWDNRTWSITNHFIPFKEQEVNSPERFESDFMVQYIKDKTFSKEAKNVLEEGRILWSSYFEHIDNKNIRVKYKLNRPDVGWYQIRNVLKERNKSGLYKAVNFKPFENVYKVLTDKLIPIIYELGFLKK